MNKITENDLFSKYEGKIVNADHRADIAESNGNGYGELADCKEYIVYLSNLCCEDELSGLLDDSYGEQTDYAAMFGITPRLKEIWSYNGIDFRVYLFIKDNILRCGYVRKFKVCEGGHFRSSVSELKANQQELRIAKRVLDYCAEE
jgi:hypothetical protein